MPHYYSEKQEGVFSPFMIKIRFEGIEYDFYSSSGVFSKTEFDLGSKVLIENAQIKENDSVLDFGCGYGVVGILISKLHKSKSIKVTMSDVNEWAVKLAKMNCKLHKIPPEKIEVIKSNVFSNMLDKKFDCILLNPPQTAGREICYKMIDESINHLNKDGVLQIVARKKKGGEMLAKRMQEVFGNCEITGKGHSFTVWTSKKK